MFIFSVCFARSLCGLNAGECDAVIFDGANLVQSPEMHLGMVKVGVLSGTSTSHIFDSTADGYGRAKGVVALYLKRLSDAIHDMDFIRCVVRGTAVNRYMPSAKTYA